MAILRLNGYFYSSTTMLLAESLAFCLITGNFRSEPCLTIFSDFGDFDSKIFNEPLQIIERGVF